MQWAKHQQKWWGKWHLYLGIIAGLIVSIVGVTGSILVFQDEIDEALNKELFLIAAKQKKIPLEQIVPLIKENYPQLSFDYIMNESDKPNEAYRLFHFTKEEEYFINPYTAQLSGKRIYETTFIHIVTDIHRSLLIPVAGRYVVGISSLILLILTITGLRLWIPAKLKLLKSVLTVKLGSSFKRQNYDWHNVLGFYTSPVVALLSLTGFCITFSLIIVPLLFILSGRSPQGVAQLLGAQSEYTAGSKTMSLQQIADTGKSAMPDAWIGGIAFPADSVGNFRLDMVGPGLPKTGKREMLIIDQYSGRVILNSRTDFPNIGNAYLSWLTPIHYGSFGGRPTQILALIGGLVPLLLFITGFIIWWPRYRKQKRGAAKKVAAKKSEISEEVIESVPREKNNLRKGAYLWSEMRKGFKYALYVLLVAGVMGAVYGAFSGIVTQPAVFSIVFTAVLVVANFIVALFAIIFHLGFWAPFKGVSRGVLKYFGLSLSFALVFTLAYILLVNTGMKIF